MITASISALQAQVWYKELFADVSTILFMDKFMGESPNNPIQVITDLTKAPGDTIVVPLTTKLSSGGVAGDSELEGNEEEIVSYSFSAKIDQLRNAVRLKGRMDERRVAYSMRKDAKEKLKIWWAERFDREMLSKLSGDTTGSLTSSMTFANTPTSPTYSGTTAANRQIFAGGVTAENSLTSSMTFDTKCIDAAKQQAMLSSPKVRAIKMEEGAYKGEDFYIIIVHPYQAVSLRQDPVWNQAQREANLRGESNPILSGALGIYNGCAIYQHELAYTFTNGSSVACARAILLGQQAGVFLKGKDADWVEKSFDFGNKWAIAAGYIFGVQKPVFNSRDYGLITISTAATAASTA